MNIKNDSTSIQKRIFKILTISLAFTALTVSIVFSQNNAQNKKETKKDKKIIYPSSKSIVPPLKKNPKTEEEKSIELKSEESKEDGSKEIKQEKLKPKPNKEKEESKNKDQNRIPIMPSSKAPDPGQY